MITLEQLAECVRVGVQRGCQDLLNRVSKIAERVNTLSELSFSRYNELKVRAAQAEKSIEGLRKEMFGADGHVDLVRRSLFMSLSDRCLKAENRLEQAEGTLAAVVLDDRTNAQRIKRIEEDFETLKKAAEAEMHCRDAEKRKSAQAREAEQKAYTERNALDLQGCIDRAGYGTPAGTPIRSEGEDAACDRQGASGEPGCVVIFHTRKSPLDAADWGRRVRYIQSITRQRTGTIVHPPKSRAVHGKAGDPMAWVVFDGDLYAHGAYLRNLEAL